MKTVIILGLILMCGLLIVWAFSQMIKALYNIKAFQEEKKNPGTHTNRGGMVLNIKTGKLEADNNIVMPF